MIRVLIVDDHPLVRAGLGVLIDSTDDLRVVAEAENGEDAVSRAVETHPDVILMDLSMPGIDGVEATRRVLAASPGMPIVVLTSFHDRERVLHALQAGAVGYLLKDSDPAELLAAIRSAARGDAPIDPRVARALLQIARQGAAPEAAGEQLSGREQQVLELITRGLSNKQIGYELGISERTVKVHAGNLFKRIGVEGRTNAALWAKRNGY